MNVDYDVVKYGLKVEGAWLLDCVVTLTLCFYLKVFVECIVFIAAFTYLRLYCGGYHCKTYLSCGIHYVCMTTLSSWAAHYCHYHGLMLMSGLVAFVYLYMTVPVENENNRLDLTERLVYRSLAKKRLWAVLIIMVGSLVVIQTSVFAFVLLDLACLCMLQRRLL